MRTIVTNREVNQRFADKGVDCSNSGRTLVLKDNKLWSFGTPLARWVGDKVLLNVEPTAQSHFGFSAFQHGFDLRQTIRPWRQDSTPLAEVVDVGCELLKKHGVSFMDDAIEVLDRQDDHREWQEPEDTVEQFEARMRATYGAIGAFRNGYDDNMRNAREFHIAGGSLLKANDKYLWSSQDSGDYFCCELDPSEFVPMGKLNTTNAALSLIPKAIRERTDLKRQGEFFFAPTDTVPTFAPNKWVRLTDSKVMGWPVNLGDNSWGRKTANSRTGHHTAEFVILQTFGNPFAKGRVKDMQHGVLDLGKVWHEVYHNTQRVSYSAGLLGIRID